MGALGTRVGEGSEIVVESNEGGVTKKVMRPRRIAYFDAEVIGPNGDIQIQQIQVGDGFWKEMLEAEGRIFVAALNGPLQRTGPALQALREKNGYRMTYPNGSAYEYPRELNDPNGVVRLSNKGDHPSKIEMLPGDSELKRRLAANKKKIMDFSAQRLAEKMSVAQAAAAMTVQATQGQGPVQQSAEVAELKQQLADTNARLSKLLDSLSAGNPPPTTVATFDTSDDDVAAPPPAKKAR